MPKGGSNVHSQLLCSLLIGGGGGGDSQLTFQGVPIVNRESSILSWGEGFSGGGFTVDISGCVCIVNCQACLDEVYKASLSP